MEHLRTFFGSLKKLRTFEAFDIIKKKCLQNLMRNIVFMYLTFKMESFIKFYGLQLHNVLKWSHTKFFFFSLRVEFSK